MNRFIFILYDQNFLSSKRLLVELHRRRHHPERQNGRKCITHIDLI